MKSTANQLVFLTGVVSLLLMICSSSTKSEEAPISKEKASIPPEFEVCMNLGPDENTFTHTNSSGNVCKLHECPVGKVLEGKPTCPPDTSPDVVHKSSCRPVERGKEMMPYPNHCERGIPCKECLHPWSIERECDPYGRSDTLCECTAPGYYLVEGECVAKPTCDKGSGLEFISGEGSAMECRRCKPGFFQPDDNSTQSCRSDKVIDSPDTAKQWTLPSSSEGTTSSEDPSIETATVRSRSTDGSQRNGTCSCPSETWTRIKLTFLEILLSPLASAVLSTLAIVFIICMAIWMLYLIVRCIARYCRNRGSQSDDPGSSPSVVRRIARYCHNRGSQSDDPGSSPSDDNEAEGGKKIAIEMQDLNAAEDGEAKQPMLMDMHATDSV